MGFKKGNKHSVGNKWGRPPIMTELVVQKLEDAFSNWATDDEACFLAWISTSTLYNYQWENPEFLEKKEVLKNMIKYHAKANIAKAIRSNDKLEDSKWYLERKLKREFGNSVDLTTDGEKIQPSSEQLALTNSLINKFLNGGNKEDT